MSQTWDSEKGEIRERFESIARTATLCRECFIRREAGEPFINIAQPRWVGPKYWQAACRVAILVVNPGEGQKNLRSETFLTRVRAFRDGKESVQAIFEHQRESMNSWGKPVGRFARFYLDGLGLEVDEVAFVNVAWRAAAGNRYPRTMLKRCWRLHTKPLLELLRPNVVLASGTAVHPFADDIQVPLPSTRVIKLFHYAHREGRQAEIRELARVRRCLARAHTTSAG